MSRPIRIEFSGALYHVTSRGDRREAIYEDEEDRERFLALLGDVRKNRDTHELEDLLQGLGSLAD